MHGKISKTVTQSALEHLLATDTRPIRHRNANCQQTVSRLQKQNKTYDCYGHVLLSFPLSRCCIVRIMSPSGWYEWSVVWTHRTSSCIAPLMSFYNKEVLVRDRKCTAQLNRSLWNPTTGTFVNDTQFVLRGKGVKKTFRFLLKHWSVFGEEVVEQLVFIFTDVHHKRTPTSHLKQQKVSFSALKKQCDFFTGQHLMQPNWTRVCQ